jgi:hypothetical protein
MARTKVGFLPVKTLSGNPPAMKNYPFASGTYYEGTVLRLSGTTGSAKAAAAAGTSLLGVCAAYITTANSTSGEYPVYLANDDSLFEAKMIATGGLLPQKRVGDVVDLAVSTANCRLQGTASTSVFSIVEVHPDEPASTTNSPVRYFVKFARSIWASTKSDSSV